jgi:capsular exopolysaccharide synthesis family protein
MTLADHLRVITTNWWRVLIVAVVAALLAYLYSSSQDNVYASHTLLSVAAGLGSDQTLGLSGDELALRADFYAAIAKTPTVAGQGAKNAKLDMSPLDAAGRISTVTGATSGLFDLKATGSTPDNAAALANGTAKALQKYVADEQNAIIDARVNALQSRIDFFRKILDDAAAGSADATQANAAIAVARQAMAEAQTQTPFAISTVTTAIPDSAPVSPTPSRDALLAFLLAGIVVAEALVILRAFSDRFARAQDAAGITEFTGLPVLAMIPRGRGPDVVEAFRTLRTNLLFLEGAGRPRTVAMISPNPGAGKSFCAIHLAESAVAVDAEVVLVDADLRRPVIHSRVRVPREPGLSDALRGADMHRVLHCVEGIPNLRVMPSGSPVSDTVGVLGGRAFRGVLDALDTAELVVVDTPPGAVYADALAVSAQCDATLLVLDAKTTRRRAARQMIDSLERTGATLIGVVVNNATYSRRDTYERG